MATRSDFDMVDGDMQEQAKQMLSCPICMDEFDCPKVLLCQHTFCLNCLKHHLEAVNSTRISPTSNFPCPTCRKTCYVPSGGMEQLATDIKVGQIKELLNMMDHPKSPTSKPSGSSSSASSSKSAMNSNSVCLICSYQNKDSPAECFCVQCKKVMCSQCKQRHVKTTIFKGHDVYELNVKPGKAGTTKGCNKHHNSEYICYCEDCKVQLCSTCVLLPAHDKHRITQTSGAEPVSPTGGEVFTSKNAQSNMDKLTEILDKTSRDCDRRIRMVGILKLEHTKASHESEAAIKKSIEDARKKLKELQLKLINDQKTSTDKKINDLNSVEKKLAEKQNSIKRLQSDISSKRQKNDVEVKQRIDQEFTLEHIPKVDEGLHNCLVFIPSDIHLDIGQLDERALDIPTGESSLKRGSTGFFSFRHKRDSVRSPTESDPPAMSPPPVQHSSSIDVVRKEAFLRNLITRFGKQGIPVVPPVAPPAAAAKPHNTDDDCCATTGSRLLQWKSVDFDRCRDCCFTDDNKVAATDNQSSSGDRIKIFNATDGEKFGFFASSDIVEPWGICFDKSGHALQTVSQTNCSVKGLKVKGMKECSMTKLAATAKPTGIAMMKSGDYVVTDVSGDTGKIVIYSPKLKKLTEFGQGEIDRANYVTVDCDDRIIVSDCDSHYIKVFSRTGESLLRFSSSGPGGQEMVPQGLAVDESNNIFVADQAIKAVSMYSKDGELIDNVVETIGVPWGISFCAQRKLLAVATDKGLEVYKL